MDNIDPLRVVFAFGVVLSLIGLCALALRFVVKKNPSLLGAQSAGRLQVVEVKMLDARRKLVLIRRDEQEHLLLLSPQGEQVIERVGPHA